MANGIVPFTISAAAPGATVLRPGAATLPPGRKFQTRRETVMNHLGSGKETHRCEAIN